MPSHRSSKENIHETSTPTKKQVQLNAHEQQQRKQILLAASIFGGVILLILLIGLVDAFILTPNKVVASVGEDEITVAEYRTNARYYRWQLLQQYAQINQIVSYFGDYDGNQYTQMQQIGAILESPESLGAQVLDSMIEEIIIRRKAEEMGIAISEEAIEEAVEAGFNFYPDGTPTPETVATTAPMPTLNAEQLLLVTPTATSEPTAIPEPTEAVVEEADESEAESGEPTATPAPTATPYTVELFEENYTDYLNNIHTARISEEDFRSYQEYSLIYEAVFDAITAEVGDTEEQVWARHILVEDETAIESILGQLESGAMTFSDLAMLFSLDSGSAEAGGDLGWFSRGTMVPEFEEAAFSLEVGEISAPVESDYGFHIIQVIAHEEVSISASRKAELQDDMFSEWLAGERAELEETININEELRNNQTPSEPSFQDPDVFEAIFGISLKDSQATNAAVYQQETEQAETLTAMPTTTEVVATAEPTAEE